MKERLSSLKKLQRKYWLLPVLFIIGAALIVRTGVFAGSKEQSKPAETGLVVKVQEVQYMETTPGITLTGSLEGQTSATISAKISGRIEQVLVQEGQAVKAGDPLVRLESVELANSARQAQESVRKAQANYDLALSDYNRYNTLYQAGATSQQQLDTVRAKLRTAEADLSSAAASQSSAEQQYENGVIVAPVDGVISNRTATIGQVVAPGTALMTVQDIQQVYAVVNVEQKDLSQVHIGQQATVSLEAYPGKVFPGVVEVMNPEAASANRMFRTKVKLDNSSGELKAGMFAKVQLATGSSMKVLAVPQSAVVQKQGQNYVFVLENSKALRRPVEIGEITGNTILIKSGLQPGDQVIISSVNRLNDGDTVRVNP